MYVGLNLFFAVLLGLGYAIGDPPNPRFAYLVLLFALCSTVVIDLDGLNGRYSLLAIFFAVYFLYFGVQDLTDVFDNSISEPFEGALSSTEIVILVGGVLLALGYRIAVNVRRPAGRVTQAYDWSSRAILLTGIALWVLGTAATYYWYFHVVTDKTLEGTKGIAGLSQILVSGLILAQMLQPVSTLLLTYAWRSTRNPAILGLVLIVIAVQVVFGFVIDIKGMALSGGFLVIATIVIGDGRIPIRWIAGVIIFIYVAFPVFQAYRAVVTGNGVARTETLSNLGKTLDIVLSAKNRVNSGRSGQRAQTFFERLSLKASVHLIVTGTANGIPFQHGHTMAPILSTFLPRIIWSDKPDIPTGRILNRVFNLSDQEETYISPSHLGDLYWNFGWAGVIVGMTAIGALCGTVARFNLAECRTVTRLLVTLVTVESVIHGFESALAGSYVVWLRLIAAIMLLHLVFARVPVAERSKPSDVETDLPGNSTTAGFPNLLT